MKIQIGKKYKTRNGSVAIINNIIISGIDYPFRGYVEDDPKDEKCWTEKGWYWKERNGNSLDLISEIQEEKMTTVSVNVEIPSEYELADKNMRMAKSGEYVMTRKGDIQYVDNDITEGKYIILRKKWKWPEVLKCKYIFKVQSGMWYGCNIKPTFRHDAYWYVPDASEIKQTMFNIEFPACDYKDSLMEKPQ
jgi:hypothetical protein